MEIVDQNIQIVKGMGATVDFPQRFLRIFSGETPAFEAGRRSGGIILSGQK
jgi:hypothetical protein